MTRRQTRNLRSLSSIWAFTAASATLTPRNSAPQLVLGKVIVCLVAFLAFYRTLLPRLRGLPLPSPSPRSRAFAYLFALAMAVAFWIWLLVAVDAGTPFPRDAGGEIVRFFGSAPEPSARGLLQTSRVSSRRTGPPILPSAS